MNQSPAVDLTSNRTVIADKERLSIYTLPLARLAELEGDVLLTFLSTYSPGVRLAICDKWLRAYN